MIYDDISFMQVYLGILRHKEKRQKWLRALSNHPLCDITGEKKSNGRRQPSDLSLNLNASAVTPNPATGEGRARGCVVAVRPVAW